MAEGTYEYECSRAELLGIAPPRYEEWQEQERIRLQQEQAQQMEVSVLNDSTKLQFIYFENFFRNCNIKKNK